MKCRECGSEGSGNYCAQCGAPLEAGPSCGECGADVDPGDRYCTECGAGLSGGGDKPWTAYLPWILSGLALVAFAVAITLFIQTQTSPRQAGGTMTGSLPGEEAGAPPGGGGMGGGAASAGGAAPAGGGGNMPSAGELADMAPREAADRLFDRAMRVRASGDTSRARFFAKMGRQAYGRVPASEMGADGRFHVGLLALVQGDTAAARSRARTILEEDPDHLLGLILALRSAASESERSSYRERFLEAASSADLGSRQAYEAHRTLIENVRQELGG